MWWLCHGTNSTQCVIDFIFSHILAVEDSDNNIVVGVCSWSVVIAIVWTIVAVVAAVIVGGAEAVCVVVGSSSVTIRYEWSLIYADNNIDTWP